MLFDYFFRLDEITATLNKLKEIVRLLPVKMVEQKPFRVKFFHETLSLLFYVISKYMEAWIVERGEMPTEDIELESVWNIVSESLKAWTEKCFSINKYYRNDIEVRIFF